MITRSNLAEQLREYQIRSKHEVDAVFVIGELFMLAFVVFSAVSLYFRYMRLTFFSIFSAILIFVCLRIIKQVRLARRRSRRMLLPLSM